MGVAVLVDGPPQTRRAKLGQKMNLWECVLNSAGLQGARHTPRDLAECDTDAGGAAGGHCLGWIRSDYFTPEVAASPFSLEEGQSRLSSTGDGRSASRVEQSVHLKTHIVGEASVTSCTYGPMGVHSTVHVFSGGECSRVYK